MSGAIPVRSGNLSHVAISIKSNSELQKNNNESDTVVIATQKYVQGLKTDYYLAYYNMCRYYTKHKNTISDKQNITQTSF